MLQPIDFVKEGIRQNLEKKLKQSQKDKISDVDSVINRFQGLKIKDNTEFIIKKRAEQKEKL